MPDSQITVGFRSGNSHRSGMNFAVRRGQCGLTSVFRAQSALFQKCGMRKQPETAIAMTTMKSAKGMCFINMRAQILGVASTYFASDLSQTQKQKGPAQSRGFSGDERPWMAQQQSPT